MRCLFGLITTIMLVCVNGSSLLTTQKDILRKAMASLSFFKYSMTRMGDIAAPLESEKALWTGNVKSIGDFKCYIDDYVQKKTATTLESFAVLDQKLEAFGSDTLNTYKDCIELLRICENVRESLAARVEFIDSLKKYPAFLFKLFSNAPNELEQMKLVTMSLLDEQAVVRKHANRLSKILKANEVAKRELEKESALRAEREAHLVLLARQAREAALKAIVDDGYDPAEDYKDD